MARARRGNPAGPLAERLADPRPGTWLTPEEEADVRTLVAAADDLDRDDPAVQALAERYGLIESDCWGPRPPDLAVAALVDLRRRDACRTAGGTDRAAVTLARRAGLGWC